MNATNPPLESESTGYTVAIDDVGYESLSAAVVLTVAEYTGTAIDEMPPLHDRLNLEALDELFEPAFTDPAIEESEVTFRYDDCWITISSSGRMRLKPQNEG